MKRKAMSVSVRCVAPRPLTVNHRHVIDPCTRPGQQVCVVSCLLSLVNRSVLSAVCFHWSTGMCCQLSAFTGQQVCVVSCLLSLVNRSVLSAVCFHWSTGLCCQLSAFTGQRVCAVRFLTSLAKKSILSAL